MAHDEDGRTEPDARDRARLAEIARLLGRRTEDLFSPDEPGEQDADRE